MNRRNVLKTMAALPVAAIAGAAYTFQIEPYWVEHVHLPLPIKNLPPEWAGRTLVQLSDIHAGNRFDYSYIIREFQAVQALAPDIVVYTGDFVSYETEEQFGQLAEVMAHAPLGKLGSAAILGNHDYGHGWQQPEVASQISNIIENVGIRVLRNEIEPIAGLNIIGIDDLWGERYEEIPVMSQVDVSDANLALCHNPDAADLPGWSGYKGWILSGHTHGGQVKPPFLAPPMLPVINKRYSAGIVSLDDGRTLYINRAIGSLWPVRFNARPEVTFFTLQTA